MAQDLDLNRFFKRAPKEWLMRYFELHGVLVGVNWGAVSVRNVDELAVAFSKIAADIRGPMVEDFVNIKLLATPAGKVQIIDEAAYHGVQEEVARKLAELNDIFACVFYVRLEQRNVWDGAVFYATADTKPKRYWHKRINMPKLGRLPTDDDGLGLANAVSELFLTREGRGGHCEVRQLRRGERADREYYFAYPQDHKLNTIQYHDGKIAKRPYNPAFEIIFEHNDSEQTLSIWHHGSKDRAKDLQQVFARSVLGTEIVRDSPRDDRVYDLDCFLDDDFAFRPAPVLGIAKVEVRKIAIRVLGGDPHIISVDLGADAAAHVLSRRVKAATSDVPASLRKVARVGCRVTFELNPSEERAKTRSFEVAWPNSCSLQNDAHGILIQRMLADHGIEPKRLEGDGGDGDKAA